MKMKQLTVILLLAAAGCSKEQPANPINNLRSIDWSMEQGEAMVVTNCGDINADSVPDYMVVKDNQARGYSGFISVTGSWTSVRHVPYIRGKPPVGREGEYMFPQRDPSGTPVARAWSAGGDAVTHIFTNGTWKESNKPGGR